MGVRSLLFSLSSFISLWQNSAAAFVLPTGDSSSTLRTTTASVYTYRSPSSLTRRRYINDDSSATHGASPVHQVRKEWIDRSVNYYSKVMREERRRSLGQAKDFATPEYQQDFTLLAKKHYFALRKIKDGKPQHAELIYRRIISELQREGDQEHCDHAKLAVTTLLLALLLQRIAPHDPKRTRSVFLNFFRVAVVENDHHEDGGGGCACSAKVLQAYALFEMKQGNALKSLQLVRKAVELDATLEPILNWKQFRDAKKRRAETTS